MSEKYVHNHDAVTAEEYFCGEIPLPQSSDPSAPATFSDYNANLVHIDVESDWIMAELHVASEQLDRAILNTKAREIEEPCSRYDVFVPSSIINVDDFALGLVSIFVLISYLRIVGGAVTPKNLSCGWSIILFWSSCVMWPSNAILGVRFCKNGILLSSIFEHHIYVWGSFSASKMSLFADSERRGDFFRSQKPVQKNKVGFRH